MKKDNKIINAFKKKIKNLRKHNQLYYLKDKPQISDAVYDQLKKDLLELAFPPIKKIVEGYQNIANYLQIAENEFPRDPIPFDLISFSNKYKTSTFKAYNIIKY